MTQDEENEKLKAIVAILEKDLAYNAEAFHQLRWDFVGARDENIKLKEEIIQMTRYINELERSLFVGIK